MSKELAAALETLEQEKGISKEIVIRLKTKRMQHMTVSKYTSAM